MAESIIDGTGNGYAAQVDNFNRLLVSTTSSFSIITGSINVLSNAGSQVLPSIQNEIKWISISGVHTGSTYYFGINDADGYLMMSLQQRTGNFSYLTPMCVSGTAILTISGAQHDGVYSTRIIYN